LRCDCYGIARWGRNDLVDPSNILSNKGVRSRPDKSSTGIIYDYGKLSLARKSRIIFDYGSPDFCGGVPNIEVELIDRTWKCPRDT